MVSTAVRARRFRLRAEEVRSIANDMKHQKTKEMLEGTARDFDNIAERLEAGDGLGRDAGDEDSAGAAP